MWNRGIIAQQYSEMLGVVKEGATQAAIKEVTDARGRVTKVPTTPEERAANSRDAMRQAKFLAD